MDEKKEKEYGVSFKGYCYIVAKNEKMAEEILRDYLNSSEECYVSNVNIDVDTEYEI